MLEDLLTMLSNFVLVECPFPFSLLVGLTGEGERPLMLARAMESFEYNCFTCWHIEDHLVCIVVTCLESFEHSREVSLFDGPEPIFSSFTSLSRPFISWRTL